jgi:hypothetical protein
LADSESVNMNTPWLFKLANEDAPSLAPLRLKAGVEVAEHSGFLWVRGPQSDDTLSQLLRGLPALERFELLSDNRMRPMGSLIPSSRLPELHWQPIKSWLAVEPPPSRPRASSPLPVQIKIVRSALQSDPGLILTSLTDWTEFALSAPKIRLRPLQFAVDAEGNVVVQGAPLPPLPGRRFALRDNIAIESGFCWQPEVSAGALARLLGVGAGVLALLYADGTWGAIQAEQFVPANRASVRASLRA